MFTRHVVMTLRAGSAAEFTRIMRDEVVPPMRNQSGLFHQETFLNEGLSEAVNNSDWNTAESAGAYDRALYPEALQALSGVLAGPPSVENFTVSGKTFQSITARRRAARKSYDYAAW